MRPEGGNPIAESIAKTGRDYILAVVFIGLIFFLVNVIAIGVFCVTGTGLIVVNLLPTLFAVVVILKTIGKI